MEPLNILLISLCALMVIQGVAIMRLISRQNTHIKLTEQSIKKSNLMFDNIKELEKNQLKITELLKYIMKRINEKDISTLN